MRIVTGSEMKRMDSWAVEEGRMSPALLMENAGSAVARKVKELLGDIRGQQVIVLAGKGNNGGDALVAARHLHQEGAEVKLFLLFKPEHFTGACRENWQYAENVKIKWHLLDDENSFYLLKLSLNNCRLVVDGIFGTGFKGHPEGRFSRTIEMINESGCPLLAIDVPSGLDADSGKIGNPCIRADYTVTMAWPKLGLVVYPGRSCAGEVTVADISLPPAALEILDREMYCPTRETAARLLPPREWVGHKNSFGHVLVLSGSRGMMGAAILAGKAGLRAGAGLVTAGLPLSLAGFYDAAVPEVLTKALPETGQGTLAKEAWPEIFNLLPGKKAVVFGPGLGRHHDIPALLHNLLVESEIPLVIDADGLNALALDIDLLHKAKGPVILTPHPGEMSRLLGLEVQEIEGNRVEVAAVAAETLGAIVVLKGAGTVIASPEGTVFVNPTGCPALATAGTGDVLAGAMGGLLAQGLSPMEAAVLAVYLHGLAGELVSREKGLRGVIAGDVLESLPQAFLELEK